MPLLQCNSMPLLNKSFVGIQLVHSLHLSHPYPRQLCISMSRLLQSFSLCKQNRRGRHMSALAWSLTHAMWSNSSNLSRWCAVSAGLPLTPCWVCPVSQLIFNGAFGMWANVLVSVTDIFSLLNVHYSVHYTVCNRHRNKNGEIGHFCVLF